MELNLEIINVKERARKPKATIQRSGKLGFNSEAIEVMKMKQDDKFLIAKSKDPGNEDNLYLIKLSEGESVENVNPIRVTKAGEYFYLNLTAFFDDLHFDYERLLYIYNIYETDYKGKNIFELKRRPIKERKNLIETVKREDME